MERRRRRRSPTSSSDSSYQDRTWSPSRPPKPPVSSWKQDKRWQLVWPNDKPRGTWGTWGRWKDIFTNKGPDIFIAEQNTPEPERPIWSNWKTPGYQHPDDHSPRWDDDGKPFRQDHEFVGVFRRDPDMKYDFATRRYRRPDDNVWSGIRWTRSEPRCPSEFRDADGIWHPLGR